VAAPITSTPPTTMPASRVLGKSSALLLFMLSLSLKKCGVFDLSRFRSARSPNR
jgi:hypothetical protein